MNAEALIIKGLISELPQADQEQIKVTKDRLKQLIAEAGDNGIFALTLVSLEYA